MQLSTWFGRTHTEPFFYKELKYPSGYIDKILKISKLPHIEIEGIFTHFAKADERNKEAFEYQLNQFRYMLGRLEEEGIQIPVVSVSCKYKSPAKFDDDVIVKTWIKKFNGIIIELAYEVGDKNDGQIRVTGESSHCFVDDKTFKPINLKREREDLYNRFEKAAEE